ncbi:MAG: hypothetical protein ACM3OB_00165 [Acidobacteriota bacterium]
MPLPIDQRLARLGLDPGLCGRCRHRELLSSERSTFLRCGLAAVDPRFVRYPGLPVLRCAGFAPEAEAVPAKP